MNELLLPNLVQWPEAVVKVLVGPNASPRENRLQLIVEDQELVLQV